MTVQQLAPWVSLLASVLTLGYVVLQEWRHATGRGSESRPSLVAFVARLDTFLYTAITMLFVAGLLHYLLTFTSFTFLVVPVWLVAVFIIVMTGATQAMPGETFDDKLQRADAELRADQPAGSSPAEESGRPTRDRNETDDPDGRS